jgi:hypothetical protein
MKRILINLTLVLVVCFAASLWVQGQQSPEAPLTNAAVVKLVRAGFKEKTVIAIIRSRRTSFNLEPDKLIELKRNGVSENVILAMLALDDSFVFDADDWTGNSDLGGRSKVDTGDPSGQDSGTNIFGGSQGSNSQTRTRGINGSSQGETTTTGSATVRILRPPTEAGGGAQQKLERTTTLNNESVIKLVEAGFSEGTIIRRIEDSPADFDLSRTKIDELRRRRVTEAIITAMTVAMSDDTELKQNAPSKIRGN